MNNFVCSVNCEDKEDVASKDKQSPCLLCGKYGGCCYCINFLHKDSCNQCVLKHFYSEQKNEKRILIIGGEASFLKQEQPWLDDFFSITFVLPKSIDEIMNVTKNNKKIDLILFDYDINAENRFMFYEFLKSIPYTENVPLLFLYGDNNKGDDFQRVNGFIPKSIGQDEICREIFHFFHENYVV